MPRQKRLIAGDDYKDAVERKKAEAFRQQALNMANEERQKRKANDAKKQFISTKRQKKLDQKKSEIDLYRSKLEKSQKTVNDNIYGIIGIVMLAIAAILVALYVVLTFSGDATSALKSLTAALAAGFVSIFAQAARLDAENQVKLYEKKLRIAEAELEKLTKPSQ